MLVAILAAQVVLGTGNTLPVAFSHHGVLRSLPPRTVREISLA